MKTKLVVSLMLLSLLTGIVTLAVQIRPARADNVILSITPSLVTQDPPINPPESFFDVFLNISSVVDLFGFDINVTWTDNTLITIDNDTSNANLNTLLGQMWPTYFIAKIENTGGGGGGGYYRVAATSTSSGFTGDHGLMKLHFKIMKNCNFLLTTDITVDPGVKLSDSVWQTIPVTAINNGVFQMKPTKPDLEFKIVPLDSHPWEYCKTFEVEVNVSHICTASPLTDYDFNIAYDSELLKFMDVDVWGDLGVGHYLNVNDTETGTIHIWDDPGGLSQSGDSFLLFALTFHIEFDDRIEHIWRTTTPQVLYGHVSFASAELSFDQGTVTDITMPAEQSITVNLIRGDVDCNGQVDVFDLRCIARYYDKKSTDPEWSTCSKYNLVSSDNTIDLFDLVAASTNFHYGW